MPFTAMADMISMTNSDMEITTGQLGIGVDVTGLDMGVSLDVGTIDVLPVAAAGGHGVIRVAALTGLNIAIVSGQIDADIEVTPIGIAIRVGIADLGVGISDMVIDVDTLGSLDGSGTFGSLGPMDLANMTVNNLAIAIGDMGLMVDVLPTVGLAIGTTQIP